MTAMRRDGAMTRRIGTQLERDAFPGSAAEGAALPNVLLLRLGLGLERERGYSAEARARAL